MKKACFLLILFQTTLVVLVPLASAKTHHHSFDVSCDVLWRAAKDAIRNSGKYGIIGVDNEEMTISYNIGGTLGGKRVNSLLLNRTGDSKCELQIQSAYTGLIHNDAGDVKERIEKSLAKLSEAAKSSPSVSSNMSGPSLRSADLKNGQTIEEVEQRAGKPQDTVNLKDSVIYIYPTGKVIFDKGQVVEVQYIGGETK